MAAREAVVVMRERWGWLRLVVEAMVMVMLVAVAT